MAKANTGLAELLRSGKLTLNGFLTFLARPSPTGVHGDDRVSRKALALWLLALSFAATAMSAIVALPVVFLTDAAPASNLKAVFSQSAIATFLTVVVLGPLVEEVIFRGWLPGTMRALAGSAAFLITWFGGLWLLTRYAPHAVGLGSNIGLAAIGICAMAAIGRAGREARPSWYCAAFPYIFWAQGLVFGGLHFANLATGSLILPLLMCLPLVMCGWLWGFARIMLGFNTAWALHMAYNVPAAAATIVFMMYRTP